MLNTLLHLLIACLGGSPGMVEDGSGTDDGAGVVTVVSPLFPVLPDKP